jgi:hypothetical protein
LPNCEIMAQKQSMAQIMAQTVGLTAQTMAHKCVYLLKLWIKLWLRNARWLKLLLNLLLKHVIKLLELWHKSACKLIKL